MNDKLTNNSPVSSENILTKRSQRVVPTHNRWRSLKINVYIFMLIGLVLFLGSCQGAQAMGWWSTSGKVTGTGQAVTVKGTDPAEIRGWMTIKQVIEAYKVTWSEFSKQFNIPTDTPLDTPLSDLEKVAPGFSTANVRTWLTERLKNPPK